MMYALAPGSVAATEIVGKSTSGKGATGKTLKAAAPAITTPIVRSVVATGRRMNILEGFID
jgi:hypothetical protein